MRRLATWNTGGAICYRVAELIVAMELQRRIWFSHFTLEVALFLLCFFFFIIQTVLCSKNILLAGYYIYTFLLSIQNSVKCSLMG